DKSDRCTRPLEGRRIGPCPVAVAQGADGWSAEARDRWERPVQELRESDDQGIRGRTQRTAGSIRRAGFLDNPLQDGSVCRRTGSIQSMERSVRVLQR